MPFDVLIMQVAVQFIDACLNAVAIIGAGQLHHFPVIRVESSKLLIFHNVLLHKNQRYKLSVLHLVSATYALHSFID